tara:strand:+ start:452 stop:634 length:183 start_codon:yes stop_codon:yes gene_type:complete
MRDLIMTYTYKHLKDSVTGKTASDVILRKEDGACIPTDASNIDYQEYLEWAKTNTAEAAD